MKKTNNKKSVFLSFFLHIIALFKSRFYSSLLPFSLCFPLWEIVAVYGGKLTKVVRLCPVSFLQALLMEEGGEWRERRGGEGMGGGGRHSPFRHIFSQSLILAFLLFF